MAKIDQNLEFFFYFAPIQFTLATNSHYSYTALMQGELQKMIDEHEGPWGAHQGVPKVPKWPILILGGAILRPFWDLCDPMVDPQGSSYRSFIFYYSPCIRSVKLCCQSELDGSKIEKKIQDLGQFQPFLDLWYLFVKPQGPLCWAPKGLESRLSFSTTLFALDQCNNKERFVPE